MCHKTNHIPAAPGPCMFQLRDKRSYSMMSRLFGGLIRLGFLTPCNPPSLYLRRGNMDNNVIRAPPDIITLYAIGGITQALFIGGLVTLGVTCLVLLSRKSQEDTAQRGFWRMYIVLLIFVNLGFLSTSFLLLRKLIYSGAGVLENQLCNGGMVLIASFTDGVLVSVNLLVTATLPDMLFVEGMAMLHGTESFRTWSLAITECLLDPPFMSVGHNYG
ncbi:hypothetical protein P691DRAFT_439464 [Macrolepiota fuliginosa MF-IS2]|uniref:Uncharacterized protein n=1 Tax=Macrolepiota fuliginosa MF-IS2 TaxID=1400762 RepID=A0A9P5X4A4_9AGAR|nr:hypothetical protein P691DRAFT_439464 [Macrolepiota fuliginosa MF-IS2]